MALSPSVLANNILDRAFKEEIDVSPLKLQKILYFIAAEYIKKTSTPLFAERFAVWKYGPVLTSVISEFKDYSSRAPITKYSKNATGEAVKYDESDPLKEILDSVWNVTKHRTGAELSRITHLEESAWWRAFQGDEQFLNDDKIKSDETYYSPLMLSKG